MLSQRSRRKARSLNARLQTLATTGELNSISDQLLTLIGNDVFDVEAIEPPSHALLTPNAAVRALITRVEAVG